MEGDEDKMNRRPIGLPFWESLLSQRSGPPTALDELVNDHGHHDHHDGDHLYVDHGDGPCRVCIALRP